MTDAAVTFERELPGLLDWHFGDAELRRITQPLLTVLGGESNALWSRFGEVHQLLLTSLPHAEGFVLPGTTHFLHLQAQNPRDMAQALAAFFARHPLPPRGLDTPDRG